MTNSSIPPVITQAYLKRESIIYIGKNNIQDISYLDLYNYFLKEKNIKLNNDNDLSYDSRLIYAFIEISPFDIQTYNEFSRIHVHNLTDQNEVERRHKQDQIDRKKGQLGYLNSKFRVNEKVFDEYKKLEQEVIQEERIEKAEKDSKNSLMISVASFIIATMAFVISVFQAYVDYYDIHYGKDFKFEKRTMYLDSVQVKFDSMQVEQNKKIIELLEKNKQKDTVIVNLQIQKKNKSNQNPKSYESRIPTKASSKFTSFNF